MITLSENMDLPLSPLSTLGEEAHGGSSTTTLQILGTPNYTHLHVSSPSHPIGTNPFEFTWS